VPRRCWENWIFTNKKMKFKLNSYLTLSIKHYLKSIKDFKRLKTVKFLEENIEERLLTLVLLMNDMWI
jgi:hypothetical protein